MIKGPSTKTIKRLFAASGGRCAFPRCKTLLVDPDTGALLAEICHIFASSPGGPRYRPDMNDENRHTYDNLLILCPSHHVLIDQNPEKYSADVLVKMKINHEATVKANLGKQRTESIKIGHINHLTRQVQDESVDFAVVVTLKEELKAVLKEFPSLRLIQRQVISSRSYYFGNVETIFGSQYRLVVAPLFQTGNLEAAHATNDLIRDWNPRYILVIGVAGGLRKGEQGFGDIVVGDNVVYYEPAKARSGGLERRARQFPSDRLLLDRVLNMTEDSWRLRLPERPDGKAPSTQYPNIYIGSIASGEKLISCAEEARKLLSMQPNLCAVERESAGVASAAFSTLKKIGFLVIRAICDFCDFADELKNDNWHSYSASAVSAFMKAFLSNRPVPTSDGQWPRRVFDTLQPVQFEELLVRQDLFKVLCKGLDMEDFKNLCFYLGVDVDELPGDKKSARVRELILAFERRGKLEDIMKAFLELFPSRELEK